ncbi:MAG: hypothetical protein FWD08_07540, partial [Alphaproteobacteria bacterium]|nr:hypothetical protein [Alphaproteobacteria bacterium]
GAVGIGRSQANHIPARDIVKSIPFRFLFAGFGSLAFERTLEERTLKRRNGTRMKSGVKLIPAAEMKCYKRRKYGENHGPEPGIG